MPAPTLSSITPNNGHAVGDVFVEIAGTGFYLKASGSVGVTFGGVPAVRVGVVSATRLLAVAPAGDPDAGTAPNVGKVDVVVENRNTAGVSQGSATLVKAFQYRRPVIDYPENFSNHPAIALVTRRLVTELQRTVIKNVKSDMHPEYASEISAAAGTTEFADLPSLKVVGPRLRDDRLRSANEPRTVDLGGGDFVTLFASRAVELEYTLVGVGKDPNEAAHLWTECKRYFEHVDFLSVPIPSSRLGSETAVLELEPDMERLGEFRGKMTRQGIAQFNMVFHVRGLIPTADRKFWASKEVSVDVDPTVVAIAPDPVDPVAPAPQDPGEPFGYLGE